MVKLTTPSGIPVAVRAWVDVNGGLGLDVALQDENGGGVMVMGTPDRMEQLVGELRRALDRARTPVAVLKLEP